VDETLDSLHARGDAGAIVVAVDHGGAHRLDEYDPWRNPDPKLGGGEGDAYVDFLARTLKPYVDRHYRTRPDAAHTGVMGSSMGGLVSLYAALRYPGVFGRAGVFSCACWIARPQLLAYARRARPGVAAPRLYFVTGARETADGGPARDQRAVVDTLRAAGWPAAAVRALTPADGRHAEWFWRREFPAAYRWLFADSAAARRTPAATPGAAAAPVAAPRAVYLDSRGVIRWRDDRSEVALFGANYTLPSASDYRAAGYLGLDRKRMVDEDMAHFARLGWDGLRLSFWGDWENSDAAGNLLANDHLDLQDYLVARARERGIYLLLSPIVTYEATWPDALDRTRAQPGFANRYKKCELGTNPDAIRAQQNYLRQLLDHVNPYTGLAYKDDPAIPFVEMINEPCHHAGDVAGSVRYIDALAEAVRGTGSKQILFHNVSQDFRIAEALRRSRVEGATIGWYPSGLNSGHELEGSYLRAVDDYAPLADSAAAGRALAGRPRLVYEFDSPDLRTGYMYPAMARAFRTAGAQFAAMFAYDMLGTASRNLGWQTHYLSLAYTPRKAVSAVVAAEAMRRLPRGRAYGPYPRNTRFGDFRVSAEENLGELAAPDAFLYAGTTSTRPPNAERLTRVAGVGSSPVVTYGGGGAYFLDRVRPGVWRLEVYPDAVPVRDPFEMQSPDKVVTRAVYRAWPMRVALPDLGASFAVRPAAAAGAPAGAGGVRRADGGRFTVAPGVYVLSAGGPVDRATLPAQLGRLRFAEYHAPPPDTGPAHVEWLAPGQFVAGRPAEVAVRVADAAAPDSVTLWARPVSGAGYFRPYPMRAADAYEYRAAVPADSLPAGVYEFAVTVARGRSAVTYPEGLGQRPWDWNFGGQRFWRAMVVAPNAPLRLFTPADDAARLAFTRVGDGGRQGRFRLVPSSASGEPAFHVELPVENGRALVDYTTSLAVADRIAGRAGALAGARRLTIRARGLAAGQVLHVTLVERDGTSWGAAVPLDAAWADRSVPLSALKPVRGVMLPQGFPGEWSYWLPPAAGRGGPGDAVRLADVERLQLSLRPADGGAARAGAAGVEVEAVALAFD
jgi:predicted alpha/beta superfamily hydrolase